MPDSPTKFNRDSMSALDTKETNNSSEMQEHPTKNDTFMQLRPVLNFSKIFNARTIQASANKFIQQMKPNEETPRT